MNADLLFDPRKPAASALRILALLLLTLAACTSPTASPSVSVSSLRLPTRVPPTLTPTPIPPDVRGYYEEGLSHQQAGDADAALEAFTQVIELAPDFAPAYVARGGVHLARGEYNLALADADAALEADSTSAAAYALRGETLRLMGQPNQASGAFSQALLWDPSLRPETFRSRWLAARAAHIASQMTALSGEYAAAHADDPLRYYYLGWALIEGRESRQAISTLIEGIEGTPDPPALLWFALGQAYAADGAPQEAVTSLETARVLVQSGDTSLAFHTDHPIADLFGALGRAYLGAGRCAEAETALLYTLEIGTLTLEYADALREARLCQTPTPTPTQYPTTTPFTLTTIDTRAESG